MCYTASSYRGCRGCRGHPPRGDDPIWTVQLTSVLTRSSTTRRTPPTHIVTWIYRLQSWHPCASSLLWGASRSCSRPRTCRVRAAASGSCAGILNLVPGAHWRGARGSAEGQLARPRLLPWTRVVVEGAVQPPPGRQQGPLATRGCGAGSGCLFLALGGACRRELSGCGRNRPHAAQTRAQPADCAPPRPPP